MINLQFNLVILLQLNHKDRLTLAICKVSKAFPYSMAIKVHLLFTFLLNFMKCYSGWRLQNWFLMWSPICNGHHTSDISLMKPMHLGNCLSIAIVAHSCSSFFITFNRCSTFYMHSCQFPLPTFVLLFNNYYKQAWLRVVKGNNSTSIQWVDIILSIFRHHWHPKY